jgi:photosystem II stability/assembly factor-like uncharacterized protein
VVGQWERYLKQLTEAMCGSSSGVIWNLSSVYAVNHVAYVSGGMGTILKTTSGGSNWFSQVFSPTGDMTSIYFLNESTGWSVGYSSPLQKTLIAKTTNGGANWNVLQFTTQEITLLNSVLFFDANTFAVAVAQTGA